ncbi:helix-turn-helix transcriptional regulator [Bacillus sp. FSL K6-1000]|uniref:helix-turn-helix domain-containing protein n=1 Tax=Bacillus sp. FSL K6-1000 TaxID=2921458 RepID=UPI00315A3DAD
MAVRYNKLFKLLIDKEMTNAELAEKASISANIITRLKRNRYVSLESIEKICIVLNCGVDEILEFITEDIDNRRL